MVEIFLNTRKARIAYLFGRSLVKPSVGVIYILFEASITNIYCYCHSMFKDLMCVARINNVYFPNN